MRLTALHGQASDAFEDAQTAGPSSSGNGSVTCPKEQNKQEKQEIALRNKAMAPVKKKLKELESLQAKVRGEFQ